MSTSREARLNRSGRTPTGERVRGARHAGLPPEVLLRGERTGTNTPGPSAGSLRVANHAFRGSSPRRCSGLLDRLARLLSLYEQKKEEEECCLLHADLALQKFPAIAPPERHLSNTVGSEARHLSSGNITAPGNTMNLARSAINRLCLIQYTSIRAAYQRDFLHNGMRAEN